MTVTTQTVTPPNGKARKAAKKAAALATQTPPVVATTPPPATPPSTETDLGELDIAADFQAVARAIVANPTKLTPAKVQKIPGVAPNSRTRAYFAGVVVARNGLAAGITDAMIAEVDALYGDANTIESSGRLRNAWHSIRGFYAAIGQTAPAAMPVAPTTQS